MAKNNSSQISIFIDKYVKFKILNENYSIDYKEEEITFSELESIIESNLKYWEEKSLDSEMCIEIRNIWNTWHERAKNLKNYLEEEDELTKEKLYGFIYNSFSVNVNIKLDRKFFSKNLRGTTKNFPSHFFETNQLNRHVEKTDILVKGLNKVSLD